MKTRLQNWISKYKIGVKLFFGTLALIGGFYAPILKALLLTDREDVMGSLQWSLLAIGGVLIFGSIVSVIKSLQKRVEDELED